jgi:hypothetical protein
MLEKLTKLASEAVQRRCLQYVVHGQVWLRQLAGLVGDEAWMALDPSQRLALASLRGRALTAAEQALSAHDIYALLAAECAAE